MDGLQLAVFDWDGTLLDNCLSSFGRSSQICSHFGLPMPTLEEYRNEIGSDFFGFYQRRGLPPSVTREDLYALWPTTSSTHVPTLHDGVPELLTFLRSIGLSIAIVSAESHDALEEHLEQFGLSFAVDFVRGSAWDKTEGLIEALKYAGVAAEEACYVDDTFDGITAAKDVGLITIGFAGGYNTRERIMEAEPDFPSPGSPNINTLAAVRDIIRELSRNTVRIT